MSASAHLYPKTVKLILDKTFDMHATSTDAFQALLCTGSASTWGSTQEGYAFVSDIKTAYTECTDGDYARQDISAGITVTQSGNVVTWSVSSNISFGSTVTISAASLFIYTTLVGSADASYPVIYVCDFGGTVASTDGPWSFNINGSGLATWTES